MTSHHGLQRIIAEGRGVLKKELEDRLRCELRQKHRRELAVSGVWRGLLLEWRIEREVRRLARAKLPSKESLFLHQP